MKAFRLLAFLLITAFLFPYAAAQQPTAPTRDRYGEITFYGIELPKTGANLLLIIDASKSMKRKDAARETPGRRWDTLLDEVRTMCASMNKAARSRDVPFTVSFLLEGGGEPHKGAGPFNMARPTAGEELLTTLSTTEFRSGGNFEVTFGETLWDFVSRHAITHVIYLGDDDIAAYATPVRTALNAWYVAPNAKSTAAHRKCQQQKATWRKTWAHWRPKRKGAPAFKNAVHLPPPPKELTFSCVAIGQSSSLLQEIATLGGGQYIERKAPSKRAAKQKNTTP